MSPRISDKQLLFLLELIFLGHEPELREIRRSQLTPAERTKLQKLGLIDVVASEGRRKKVVLEDAAWALAGEELGRDFAKVSPLTRALLGKIAAYLHAHDLPLADFTRTPANGANGARDVIRSAYLNQTGGDFGVRVRIRDLRAATGALSREDFDRELTALLEAGLVKLYAFDNPREKTSDDERDAVVISGVRRHVVYLEA